MKPAALAPLWARVLIIILEAIIWLVTFGRVNRVETLEALFYYSPHWRERYRAEESIKGALRSGMGAACRLARPLLHIETELSTKSSHDDRGDSLTPRTMTACEKTLEERQRMNARIRNCLRNVPVDDLQAPLLMNACTWNVNQQVPPVNEEAFLSWLIGQELTEEVKQYHEHKQAVAAYGGFPGKPHYPTGLSAMRSRKASLNSISNVDISRTRCTTPEDVGLADQQRAAAAALLQNEWRGLEAKLPDLFLISLQEVEMTGTALVKESTQRSWEWADAIIETLAAATDHAVEYKKVQVVQLVGLVLIVLVQARHVDYVSHVRLSLTRTGALSVLGNKGSVAMRATIYGKRFLFISAHFVAHKHNERRRMSNYQAALKDIRFDMPAWSDDESEVLQTFLNAKELLGSSVESLSVRGNRACERLLRFGHTAFHRSFTTDAEIRVLDDHDYVFFLGDLNSRLHALPSPFIREAVRRGEYDHLLCHDELRQLMVSGEAFDGFKEQWISFPPTYKYDRGTDMFDTSRKRRDPAWCDRVLFRVLESDAGVSTPREEDSVELSNSQVRFAPPLLDLQCSTPLQNDPTATGAWISLEELESKHFSLSATSLAGTAPARSSSSASSEDPSLGRSLSLALQDTSMAVVAARNDFGSPDKSCQYDSASLTSRAQAHAVWEKKPCAQTFCAARRSRCVPTAAAPPSSSLKADLSMPARFPMVINHVNPLEYTSVSSLRQSDHRPVRARFEVKVIVMEPALVTKVVKEVQRLIN
ncbi:hypothetical protein JKF63_01732 [Porcisia hertigi]|uniref:Inositol polyphosphate-related phosphatase domain-containing protein n=1 Tax=Porcisia hertigi TaxID=2761500 RepID=A0A836IEU4_9TRYP|nr:hypothetical protein JKF63_01732 [Porcisia hertigi]